MQMANTIANSEPVKHGGFTYLFIKLFIGLFKFWLIVCQQWRHHAFSRTHWGIILRYSLNLETPFCEICLHLINMNDTLDSLLSLMRSSGAGKSSENPLQESGRLSSAILITLPIFNYWNQSLQPHLFIFLLLNPHNFDQYNNVKYLAWLYWLWCVLCWTNIKWTQSAEKQLAGHTEFNWAIGASSSKDAIDLHDSIPSAPYFHD